MTVFSVWRAEKRTRSCRGYCLKPSSAKAIFFFGPWAINLVEVLLYNEMLLYNTGQNGLSVPLRAKLPVHWTKQNVPLFRAAGSLLKHPALLLMCYIVLPEHETVVHIPRKYSQSTTIFSYFSKILVKISN